MSIEQSTGVDRRVGDRRNSEDRRFSERREKPTEKEDITLKFKKDTLLVTYNFQVLQTGERYEEMIDYYQWLFSERKGRIVPREKIIVRPRWGEKVIAQTHFSVKAGEPIWAGLHRIHGNNPTALPKLVKDMEKYKETHKLTKAQRALVQHTVSGLKEIIESRENPLFTHLRRLPVFSH